MASGMGMPSIGIYSYELFHFYGVENIIRIGSAGMIQQDLKLRSVVAAMSAYSNSAYGKQFGFEGNLAPCASWKLLKAAYDKATEMGVNMPVGPRQLPPCRRARRALPLRRHKQGTPGGAGAAAAARAGARMPRAAGRPAYSAPALRARGRAGDQR